VRRLALGVLCLAVLLAGCGRDPLGARTSNEVGVTAFAPSDRVALPDIAGSTLDGSQLAVAGSRGKVVVLNSWASWCLPCNDEAEALVAASKRFTPLGVSFIGLDVSDEKAAAHHYTRRYGVPYPSILDPDGTLLASIPSIPPGALPSTLILDREGRIAVRFIGAVQEPSFTEQLNAVLAEE